MEYNSLNKWGVRMTKSLEAHDKLLKEVFSDEYQFQIPDYQRPYSWTTEQTGDLLSDLVDAMRDHGTKDKDSSFYFIGSVVLIKSDRNPMSDVVDGQQRLTTLTILFAVLRELLPDKSDGITSFLYKKGLGISDDEPNEYRLRAIDEDAMFFRDHIQEPGGIQRLIETTEKLEDSRLRFKENATLLMSELSKLDHVECLDLLKFIVYNCSIVVISTPNLDAAYRIFSVLNNRGLDLSPTDILKAEILGDIRKISGEIKSKEYAKKWIALERHMGRDDFSDVFSHVRAIYAKKKQNTILTKEFKEYVRKDISAEKLFDNVIAKYAEIYGWLKNCDFAATEGSETINEQATHLGKVDWKDWLPPAMLFFNKFRNKPHLIAQFLVKLERLTYFLFITKAGINIRIVRYAELMKEIEKEDFDGESGALVNLSLSDEEKRTFIRALDGDIYRNLPKARAALILRLESLKSDGSKKQQFRNVSIEHVLPQTPSEGSEWLEIFPDENIRLDWTQRLANLVPLHIRKNPAASNYDFVTKKGVYFNGKDGTASPFVLTQEVRSLSEWTPDILMERQKKLLDVLIKHWDLS